MNSLSSRRLLLVLCLLLGSSFSFADSELSEGVTGLLVLHNGNVIEGRVTRLADHFCVEIEHGQLRVRVDQVEMHCRTLDEAYERRREMRVGSTADSHVELVAWCLRHGLLEYASRELVEARTIDPHHRKVLLLERQLNQALQRQVKPLEPSLPEKIAPPVAEVDLSTLDRAPQWARVLFVRKIQPILAKSCAVSCHQTDSSQEWQLDRLAVDGAGHPETTKQNLAGVLAWVDFQNAGESQLLRFADMAHASGKARALPPYQLQMLRAWIEQLAMADSASETSAAVQRKPSTWAEQSSVARLAERIRRKNQLSEMHGEVQQVVQQPGE